MLKKEVDTHKKGCETVRQPNNQEFSLTAFKSSETLKGLFQCNCENISVASKF